jgi:hypothetical protein
MDEDDADPTRRIPVFSAQTPKLVAGAMTGMFLASVLVNVWLWRRASNAEDRIDRTVVAAPRTPPTPPCPTCPECPPATVCEPTPCPTDPTGPAHAGGPPRPVEPREDAAVAAEGEQHLAQAADAGERNPVELRAQRQLATGVDRIVASRSPAAAERFLTRNLPSVASMNCAFRDPAMAEHVRMQLRPMNALARPQFRLSEADLQRYERELRCPRE